MAEKACQAKTVFWRADDLGAELLRGWFTDFSYDLHTHDTACLALITGGAIRIRMRRDEFIARAGDLYAIDADEPHAGWPVDADGWRQRTIYVGLARLAALVGDGGHVHGSASVSGPLIRDARLNALLYSVHRCSEEHGPRLLRDERYLDFATCLFERHVRNAPRSVAVGREDRAIGRARDFLDHHLAEQVSLPQIAAAAGLPPFRLYRAFERRMGMTPHGYQRQARIRSAIALIRLGHSLADAAAAAGFADQAHMTRNFYRRMGVTPGVYRSAHRRSASP